MAAWELDIKVSIGSLLVEIPQLVRKYITLGFFFPSYDLFAIARVERVVEGSHRQYS